MAIEKESLNNFLPNGFETLNQEGYKENFTKDKIKTGYQKDVPDLVAGANLNNLIDVIGKNTNTLNSYVEYLNSLKIGESPIIDVNNKLNNTKIGLRIYSATETYSLNNLVSTVEDGKVKIYRSLVANNLGNVLTNEQYWEEVKLGGDFPVEVQNMYTTGAVSTDTQGYNQLLEMRRSTFDKSKFTVVGNPVITDDGVASGFSSGNKVSILYTIQNTTNFTIKGSFTFPTAIDTSVQSIVLGLAKSGSDTFLLEYRVLSGGVGALIYSNGAGTHGMLQYNLANELPVSPNKTYNYTITVKGSNITLNVEGVVKTANDFYFSPNTSFYVGCDRNGNTPFSGSIDLSQFSITVDGKEVFSGNKTGIDNIKADNYEVVGSPVISDDGVITTSVGINTYKDSVRSQSITLSNSEKFCIFCKLPKRALEDIYRVLRLQQTGTTDDNNNYNFNLEARRDIGSSGVGYRFVYFVTENNVRSVKTLDFQIPEILNQDVSVKIEYSAEQNTIRIYKYINNQEILITSRTLTAPLSYIDEYGYLHIGMTQGYSIDLNAFKIYVDGKLVYQPCLKIPYTRADSKSKIVDVAYRDRVQDLYEQEGLAGYYTIDEENQNFTLPMGEIYGMIEQAKSSADSKVSKSGDTMTGQLKIKCTPIDDSTAPLILYQQKASDFGAPTYSNIVFKNSAEEDVGIIGGTENTDGSHRIRLLRKDGSNWVEIPQIIDVYRKDKNGYNIYTNGYCEQWGWIGSGTGTGSVRYNFLKPFAADNFNITYSIASNDSHTRWANQMSLNGWDVNGFKAMNVGGFGAYWCARGYV